MFGIFRRRRVESTTSNPSPAVPDEGLQVDVSTEAEREHERQDIERAKREAHERRQRVHFLEVAAAVELHRARKKGER